MSSAGSQNYTDWAVDVKFKPGRGGTLQATATGVLLVPPAHVLTYVTDPAGDDLFRVVQRKHLPPAADGSQQVQVENRAAIRVLAWKFWTRNEVVYQISAPAGTCTCSSTTAVEQAAVQAKAQCAACSHACNSPEIAFHLQSSNMLTSLSGTWQLEPITIRLSQHPHLLANIKLCSKQMRLPTAEHTHYSTTRSTNLNQQHGRRGQLPQREIGLCHVATGVAAAATDSSAGYRSTMGQLPAGLVMDTEGNISATLVKFQQLAQPKGMPPGVRFVPGLSDAVRMSVGREVRQMLDKIKHVSWVELSAGLSPQAALTHTCQQLDLVGGSFKNLQKLREQQSSRQVGPIAPEEAALAARSSRSGSRGNLCCKKGDAIEVSAIAPCDQGKAHKQRQVLKSVPSSLLIVHPLSVDDEPVTAL